MSALFSLIPICLLIFAGYLYWFRDHIVTLLELSSHREIVILSVAYACLALLGIILVVLKQFEWLLGLLILVSVLSAILSLVLTRFMK